MSIVSFILAAGRSKRMESHTPKVFLPLGGRTVIEYSLEVARCWAEKDVYTVLSASTVVHQITETLGSAIVIQEAPLGTGDAFRVAFREAVVKDPDFLSKDILVLLGDTPLVQVSDLTPLIESYQSERDGKKPDIAVMGMTPPSPEGYGRLVTSSQGQVTAIIECAQATPDQKKISLCNTGVMLIRASSVAPLIDFFERSSSGEFYLTDLIAQVPLAVAVQGDWESFAGFNTRQQWHQVEHLLQKRFRERAIQQGAFLLGPETTFFSYDTQVGKDVMIHPHTVFGPGVQLEDDVTILSFSVLTQCQVQSKATVGPFAHIRGGCLLGPQSYVGNFVEVKNTVLGEKSQAKHLTYLGDATIGDHVNIGAGVITCNYDGVHKYATVIEDRAFIGSHSTLIAPITIGEQAFVGAGSTLTKNVSSRTLALSRAPQKDIPLSPGSKLLREKPLK